MRRLKERKQCNPSSPSTNPGLKRPRVLPFLPRRRHHRLGGSARGIRLTLGLVLWFVESRDGTPLKCRMGSDKAVEYRTEYTTMVIELLQSDSIFVGSRVTYIQAVLIPDIVLRQVAVRQIARLHSLL